MSRTNATSGQLPSGAAAAGAVGDGAPPSSEGGGVPEKLGPFPSPRPIDCPCGRQLSVVSEAPEAGAIALCLYCARPFRFAADLSAAPMTAAELSALPPADLDQLNEMRSSIIRFQAGAPL